MKNSNLNICRRLVWRDLKFHKLKSLLLVLAAVLITGLYSFAFLVGDAVEGAHLLNFEYMSGTTSHIQYPGLNRAQAESVLEHPNIKSGVLLSTVGLLSDPMIGQRTIKLAVTDQDYAESILSLPTTGRLPEKFGEVALDEYTMNSLGVVKEVGQPVSLRWTDPDGEEHETEFTLCGWWASPMILAETCAWISPESALYLLPGYDSPDASSVTLGVKLHKPRDLELQAQQILDAQGVKGAGFATNIAYNEMRKQAARSEAYDYYWTALVVLVCGFLMVYCVIQVAPEQNLSFYASVKALGMTPRQVYRMLWEQAWLFTLLGLLPGWLVGFGLHYIIIPIIVVGLPQNPALMLFSWQPYAAAGACAWMTISLALGLLGRRLGRATPMQLLNRAPRTFREKEHSRRPVTILRLALRALGRNKVRFVLSMLSLLLALLPLSAVWIQYASYDESIYLEYFSPWDYAIADGSASFPGQRYNPGNRALTDETVTQLQARPEVTAVSVLKTRELDLAAPDELRRALTDYYNLKDEPSGLTRRESMAGDANWMAGLERLETEGRYTGVVVGLEGAYLNNLLQKSTATDGSYDPEAFSAGGAVFTAGANAEGVSTPPAGAEVQLADRSFQVMASLAVDSNLLSGSNSPEAAFCILYVVPLEVFDEMFPGQAIRQLAVDIDDAHQAEFEEYLDSYEQELNRGVSISRRSSYQENFQSARISEVSQSFIVCAVLLGIGFLSFINMLTMKTVMRRREFAVYESLGMTYAQLRRLLVLEGLLHGLLLAAVLALVTVPATWFGRELIFAGMNTWFMTFQYTLAPLWCSLLLLLLFALVVPLACLRLVRKGSITQRMQNRG